MPPFAYRTRLDRTHSGVKNGLAANLSATPTSAGRRRVLAVCGDPGGAAAIAPVIAQLSRNPLFDVRAYAYGPGIEVLRARGISCDPIPETAGAPACESIWAAIQPDILLTASSVNDVEYEKIFTRIARARVVPSLCVIDSWSSYGRRFGPRSGVFDALPDRIAVIDERSREEWLAAGVPRERIVVTGQPVFDELCDVRTAHTDERRARLRERLGVSPQRWLAVFVSQPIRELTRTADAKYIQPGYDQHEVMHAVVDVLRRAARARGAPGVLVVRPHPREIHPPSAPSDEWLAVLEDRSEPLRELMAAADLVVGMASIALIEACYLGCMVVSCEPNSPYEATVVSGIRHVCASARRWEDIGPAVEGMLFDRARREEYAERLQQFRTDGKATERVVELLKSMALANTR
jgi:hypothetical protein